MREHLKMMYPDQTPGDYDKLNAGSWLEEIGAMEENDKWRC